MLSRETWIGVAAFAVATYAMAIDHLVGTDPDAGESFPVDPFAFAITVGLSAVVAALVFGRLVPRTKEQGDPRRAARLAAACSGVAVVPGFLFLWFGVPFVFAGGGVALGVLGRAGERRGLATAAVVVGAVVLAVGVVGFTAALVVD